MAVDWGPLGGVSRRRAWCPAPVVGDPDDCYTGRRLVVERLCRFAPNVSVRAMSLSVIRFGIADAEPAYMIEKGWSAYPALHCLENQRWVASEWKQTEANQRAKFYRLTAAGRKQLAAEQSHWRQLADAMAVAMNPP